MKYSELVQAYFERSSALQWYWTIYIVVIGGVLAFSSFRQHKDIVTTILVTALYLCFAYKNLGAIETTLMERQAILSLIKEISVPDEIKPVRQRLEPTLTAQEPEEVRYFHWACDLMTIAAVWAKESRRTRMSSPTVTPA